MDCENKDCETSKDASYLVASSKVPGRQIRLCEDCMATMAKIGGDGSIDSLRRNLGYWVRKLEGKETA